MLILMLHTNLEIDIFDFSLFGILVPNYNMTPSLGFLAPKGSPFGVFGAKWHGASNYDVIIAIMMS